MPKRSRICLDLACMVLELSPKCSQIWLAGTCGVWEGSKRKFTMPSAWMMPQAQVGALPCSSGDGRFRARVAVNCRQSKAYSSVKYAWAKSSVSWLMLSNRACRSLGTFCEVLRLGMTASSSSQLLTARLGSCPYPVPPLGRVVQHAAAQQIEVGPPEGLALEHLESIHLSFYLPLTVRGEQRCPDCGVFSMDAPREADEFRNMAS